MLNASSNQLFFNGIKDDEVRQQLTQRWLTLDPNFRQEIKNLVVQTFGSNTLARHQAAQVRIFKI